MDTEEMDFMNAEMLRRKAEEQLKSRQEKSEPQDVLKDVTRLLHEIQVHQIELEMQNEELRTAYQTAETALKKYTMLYDLAPMGYFTLSNDGQICDLNFTGADMLGDKRYKLVNSNFKLFISEDSRTVFNDFFRKVYTSHAKESCELSLGYNNHHLCQVYMEGIVNEDDQKCLLSILNISGFKNK